MNESVRVRFAPSPTGPLHVGGLRTALFNYLFAKKNNGVFVLRIEDTDTKRKVRGAEEYLQSSLEWCGIVPDESMVAGGSFGPYRQSERAEHYKKHIEALLKNGSAYYAFDSEESIEQHRKDHAEKGKTFIYNWHNRLKLKNSLSLPKEEVEKLIKAGEPFVVRFKSPENKKIIVEDLIRGQSIIESNILDDKILYKSDGSPTYHLANVVDDHLMKITHVIRGEEWLPSLPLHFMLYEAFGWACPAFAHLPLILSPTGKGKLSKRSGEKEEALVYPLKWGQQNGYKEAGIISEGLINYLALLGWSPESEKEIYLMKDLIRVFSLENVSSAGAKFDFERLKWFNLKHLQQKSAKEILSLLIRNGYRAEGIPKEKAIRIIGAAKARANTLNDLWSICLCFYEAPKDYKDSDIKKAMNTNTPNLLDDLAKSFDEAQPEGVAAIKSHLDLFCKSRLEQDPKTTTKEVMMPLRLALVGSLSGLDISYIIFEIGLPEAISRIKRLSQY